jgi:isoleucyl-tRNA synthetase
LYVDLIRFRDSLKELFNVSAVQLTRIDTEPLLTEVCQGIQPLDLRFRIKISSASGHKCARCWNFMPQVSNYGIWQNVCTRCQNALKKMKITPPVEAAK